MMKIRERFGHGVSNPYSGDGVQAQVSQGLLARMVAL